MFAQILKWGERPISAAELLTAGVIKETLLLPLLTKTPNNGRKGPPVFRRWATHKHLQARFIRLALRFGMGVLWGMEGLPFPVFTTRLGLNWALHVPAPLMTQNLIHTIIQYSIMLRLEVVQPIYPYGTSARVSWQQHHVIISGNQK